MLFAPTQSLGKHLARWGLSPFHCCIQCVARVDVAGYIARDGQHKIAAGKQPQRLVDGEVGNPSGGGANGAKNLALILRDTGLKTEDLGLAVGQLIGKGQIRLQLLGEASSSGPVAASATDTSSRGAQRRSDLTDLSGLAITIRGEPYQHLMYRFVLPVSNWARLHSSPWAARSKSRGRWERGRNRELSGRPSHPAMHTK